MVVYLDDIKKRHMEIYNHSNTLRLDTFFFVLSTLGLLDHNSEALGLKIFSMARRLSANQNI